MLAPKRSNFGACCQCVIQIELLQHVIYSKHVNWLKVWNDANYIQQQNIPQVQITDPLANAVEI